MILFFYSTYLLVLQYYLTMISCTFYKTKSYVVVNNGTSYPHDSEEGRAILDLLIKNSDKALYFYDKQDSNNSSDQDSSSNIKSRIYRANFNIIVVSNKKDSNNKDSNGKVPRSQFMIKKVLCSIYTMRRIDDNILDRCINLDHECTVNTLFYNILRYRVLINKLLNHADSICIFKVFDRRRYHPSNIVGSDVEHLNHHDFERKYPASVHFYNLQRVVKTDDEKDMKCESENCSSDKNCLYKIKITLSDNDCIHIAVHLARMLESGLSEHRSLFMFDKDDYMKKRNKK